MKVLVLGAGMMGSAVVFDLARSLGVEHTTVADVDAQRSEEVAKKFGCGRASSRVVDVRNRERILDLMKSCDTVISAVPLNYNDMLTEMAIQARVSFCDLGGSNEILARQKGAHEEARVAGVTVIPNCGLAPGMANVLAVHGVRQFDHVDEVKIRVGGLPQQPRPPFNYQLVFSVQGLIEEYTEPVKILKDGKINYVDPLTGVEQIEFPAPYSTLEAFYTSAGASLLPELLEGKVRSFDCKTIRYPGHAEKMRNLLEIGFADAEPINTGGQPVTARELFGELLRKKLSFSDKDVVLLRVIVRGIKNGKEKTLSFTVVDGFDEKTSLTAMMRTTAFPTSVIAQMIAEGKINAKGVYTPEECVPPEPFIEELRRRNIVVKENWS